MNHLFQLSMKASVAAIDTGGVKEAQFHIRRTSHVADAFGMISEKEFVNTLEDIIQRRGAMELLISDNAKSETSGRVDDVLRAYKIKDWQSEPYFQHQNFAERGYRDVKARVIVIMNASGAAANEWLLILKYVIYIHNRMAQKSLGWKTPLEVLTGQTPDISIIYQMPYRTIVYFKRYEEQYPHKVSSEDIGYFVGFAETVGHNNTFLVLTRDTKKVIARSRIRLANELPNKRLLGTNPDDDDDDKDFVKVETTSEGCEVINPFEGDDIKVDDIKFDKMAVAETVDEGTELMFTIPLESLTGRSFLLPIKDDGTHDRTTIIKIYDERQKILANEPDLIKLRIKVNDEEYDELIAYNEMNDFIEERFLKDDGVWKFRKILDHQGPLSKEDPRYQGSKYNVLIEWETGEWSWEPTNLLDLDDHKVDLAMYARDNGLLELPGWKHYKKLAKRKKKLDPMVKQAKLKSFKNSPKYMFGIRVRNNHEEAMYLDKINGNTLWADAELKETGEMDDIGVFRSLGYGAKVPSNYKLIKVHMVYAVKHDGRHKARLVANGNLTGPITEANYSGVVSLRSIRLIAFIGELNELELWAADISNTYVMSYTNEKVCIIAGPEFGSLEGHLLIIVHALYGLKFSGVCWHVRISQVLIDMGFKPCRMDPDVWLRDKGDHYEYIGTYVGDLCIASKDPEAILKFLIDDYKFQLKGVGPMSYHLGCDFFHDKDGTLCQSPKKYIIRLIENYVRMFGNQPRKYTSPLEKEDHPELDISKELDVEDIKKYQSLIGCLQWMVSLGRFDISTATMSMLSFRANPREGHLERLKRIVGYCSKMRDGAIRYRTARPDLSHQPIDKYSWDNSVYGDAKEDIPNDIPEAKGNIVDIITYVDANLLHDMISGKSVTGIMHFVNQTPIDSYSKKQNTVETSTFSSEFVAARIATEQIIDL